MNIIALLRGKKKLSQQALADLMEIDRTTVSKWETGESMPRADKLPLLAKILKCSTDELLSKDKSAV
jgi:transcriptional regulator with XRE-family HTH domain